MKHIIFLLFSLFIYAPIISQDFEWATLIDNVEANEVAGLDVDSTGHVIMTGILGDDMSLPYNGSAYVTRTDADGTELWTNHLGTELIIGDLVCAGENIIIVAQSTAPVTLDDAIISDTSSEVFLALIVLNSNGEAITVNEYPQNNGQFANLDYDDGVVALQCSGAFNSGEYVIYFNSLGEEIGYHELDLEADIVDIAYHNTWTYLCGGGGFSEGLSIDNVELAAPEMESLSFVLGFDASFTAQWGHGQSAINSNDNTVVADASGIFSYQSVLLEEFEFSNVIWKFDAAGVLIDSIQPPTYTSAVSLYPDMAISDCHLVLFTSNSSDFNSHEVILFDHNLEVIEEKQIVGNSNLYSGQVTTYDNQIYVAHVHTDELDFNGEVIIEDSMDDAFQFPYLAKIAVAEDCGPVQMGDCSIGEIDFTLQECFYGQFFVTIDFEYENTSDGFEVFLDGTQVGANPYGEGPYLLGPYAGDGTTVYNISIVDGLNDACSSSFSFVAVDCGVGACVIDNFEMTDIVCDSDSTYSMTFDADFIDPTGDFFELWVNVDSIGSFPISDLPLTVSDIAPTDAEFDFISICVTDDPLCCLSVEYIAPDCMPDALMEFNTDMSLHPNPSNGRLILELPENMEVERIEVIDLLGHAVLMLRRGQDFLSNRKLDLDISRLGQGTYVLTIVTEKGVYGRRLVKE